MEKCNVNLQRLIDIANQLIDIANEGDIERTDDSCGVLYGLARDYGNRLLRDAQYEYDKHRDKGLL